MKKHPLSVQYFALLFTQLGMLCLLLLPEISVLAAATDRDGSTLLVLGDSISAAYGIQRQRGWVALLQQRLNGRSPPVRVINASVSGDTTQGGIARLPRLLATHQPQFVIIELGGNDGLRGYPPAKIQQNLETLAQRVLATGARVLLIGMHIPPNYGPRYSTAFHTAFVDAAQASQTALVPFLLQDVARKPDLMQNDGIHPTVDAQPAMLESAWPYIEQILNNSDKPHR